MGFILAIYISLVLGLLWAELKESPFAQRIFKPAAAIGFIVIALVSGALDSQYGKIILAGLAACAAGDVFLLSRKSEKLFLMGMAAFALGHFAYLSAFVPFHAEGYSVSAFLKSMIAIISTLGVLVWLNPRLHLKMKMAVRLYGFIILIMVINALDLPPQPPLVFAMIGAVMFAISDVFVAKDRFICPSPRNALAITPLYFAAQALIALSTQAGI